MVLSGNIYFECYCIVKLRGRIRISTKEVIDINNYDYVMFVDASGDDGFKFGKNKSDGSSVCYAICSFLIEKNDLNYNINILNNIKKIIGTKAEDEVKYSVLRRHPKNKESHLLLSKLKGTIYSMIAFKKEIKDPDYLDVSNKLLSSLCHTFPINVVSKEFQNSPDKSILIVVDRMKKIEMDTVKELVESKFGVDTKGNSFFKNYTLIFRDSKDKDYVLIQIADMLAGTIRNFFEYFDSTHSLWNSCNMCRFKKNLCKYKRMKQLPENSLNFKLIYKLLKNSKQKDVLTHSILTMPAECWKNICFIDCLKWI